MYNIGTIDGLCRIILIGWKDHSDLLVLFADDVVLVLLLGDLAVLVPGLEPEEEEGGVKDESDGDGEDGVHEEVELHVLEAVLLQPRQHLRLRQQVVCNASPK